jgi:fatty-acyl-CoA synthase
VTTVSDLIRSRVGDNRIALYNDDQTWTHQDMVQKYAQRAGYILSHRQKGPFHVGVLLENVPEYPMWLGGCAAAGAGLVALNPTRQGADLERDIRHTNCQFIITEEKFKNQITALNLEIDADRIHIIESERYRQAIELYSEAILPEVAVKSSDIFCMMFTSGTTGAPKACICSQGRYAAAAVRVTNSNGLGEEDISYVAMPMYHGNSVIIGFLPTLVTGGAIVLRRKFSASGFLPDIRRYGATFFNYVGKPLAYILATPEQEDDAENTLTNVAGNEAAESDIQDFSKRFNCVINDNYGSSEGCVAVMRTADMPAGSLGRGVTESIKVLDSESGAEKIRALFDGQGRLLNSDEAIGELVNTEGGKIFEGYWNNNDANAARIKNGVYWSGDLAYRDTEGFLYFAGRSDEWMRIDGENIAAAQVEVVLYRHPDVVLAAVYAVPDPMVGDQVMAALQLKPGLEFEPEKFIDFIGTQKDFGSKWQPKFIRVSEILPVTHTVKVLKRPLRRERWQCQDVVWQSVDKGSIYRVMESSDKIKLDREFTQRNRADVLEFF